MRTQGCPFQKKKSVWSLFRKLKKFNRKDSASQIHSTINSHSTEHYCNIGQVSDFPRHSSITTKSSVLIQRQFKLIDSSETDIPLIKYILTHWLFHYTTQLFRIVKKIMLFSFLLSSILWVLCSFKALFLCICVFYV